MSATSTPTSTPTERDRFWLDHEILRLFGEPKPELDESAADLLDEEPVNTETSSAEG